MNEDYLQIHKLEIKKMANVKLSALGEKKLSYILDVAEKLFMKTGYHATGMKMLADESGISKASLYHYFTSKEELLLFVLERCNKRLMQEVLSKKYETFEEFLDALASYFVKCGGHLLLKMYQEVPEYAAEIFKKFEELFEDPNVFHMINGQMASLGAFPTAVNFKWILELTKKML